MEPELCLAGIERTGANAWWPVHGLIQQRWNRNENGWNRSMKLAHDSSNGGAEFSKHGTADVLTRCFY